MGINMFIVFYIFYYICQPFGRLFPEFYGIEKRRPPSIHVHGGHGKLPIVTSP